ncbi:MAG: hypothetical protein N3F04_06530 [Candidatus Nezhaarchaeota archaeon]|nr:hypothetical protein [Candidatus Nezhaarchaeota archaeon]MCX8142397.1 hypothetical protein [Candidatus Nezhaarchaeota archaeon]MDW8050630.1 hypothetical protein [Nitrososphaerota archaeon]
MVKTAALVGLVGATLMIIPAGIMFMVTLFLTAIFQAIYPMIVGRALPIPIDVAPFVAAAMPILYAAMGWITIVLVASIVALCGAVRAIIDGRGGIMLIISSLAYLILAIIVPIILGRDAIGTIISVMILGLIGSILGVIGGIMVSRAKPPTIQSATHPSSTLT